jgi:hypothetical protein
MLDNQTYLQNVWGVMLAESKGEQLIAGGEEALSECWYLEDFE